MARPRILQTYRDTMVTHLQRKFGFSAEEADRRFRLACKDRYSPMTAVVVETLTEGLPQLKAVDLVTYLDKHADDILSPNGSFYCQHDKKTGKTIQMILNRLKLRKKFKKEMLRFKAIGDTVNQLICYYLQTVIKIGVNSLPGNYGSPYSIFYSKDNYNSITSSGRALIGYANTCIEHVLGGNFGWFSIDQLINHVTIHLQGSIDPEKVRTCLQNHSLRFVSKAELAQFFKDSLCIYHRYTEQELARVDDLVSHLTDEEVQFFWYYQNLRHIIIGNDNIFRPWAEAMFDLSNVKDEPGVVADDLFKLDGALVTMVNVAFNAVVGSGDPEIQVYDLPKHMPDKAVKFVNIAHHVERELKTMDDIFDTFIFTDLCVPDVLNRKFMQRNSSVISDTDSVIFTVKDWVQWYTGDIYKISPGTYHIACLMIYWITLAVAHVLKLYSICHGAKGDRVRDMAMKNEFLYPTMCLADIKKTYAGVITVQEGVILPKPSTDIKGVQLKGSDICKAATQFGENFIVQDILLGSLNQKISGHDLIKKAMEWELKIYSEVVKGSITWCQPQSIKSKDGYAKPMSSPYYYYYAWQEIFAWKYGDIQIPTKCIVVPITGPTREYFDDLRKSSPKVARLFEGFILANKKPPSKIALAPTMTVIPKELMPLVMVRDIVHENTRPIRLILQQVGVTCGFVNDDNAKLLFNEVYGDHRILSRLVNTTRKQQDE